MVLTKSERNLEIVQIKIADLLHPDYNPRYISDLDFEQLKKSLTGFGAVEPAVVNQHHGRENIIVGGNQRIRAAQELGWSEFPCVNVDLDEKRERELNIRLNKNVGEFDFDILANEFDMADLKDWGFADEDLKIFDSPATSIDADPKIEQREELVKKYGVEYGQLWQLGEHRLLCGDSTSGGDVNAVMRGEKASLVFTDPPYGVSIGSKNAMLNNFQKAERCSENIEADEKTPEELKKILLPAFLNVRELVMADDCTVFVTAPQGGELGMMMMMMMKEAGLLPRHVLIWKKNAPTFSMGRLDYDYQHEPILLTWLKRHKRPMNGEHKTSVWEIDKPRKCDVHPTMKPVELIVNAIKNNSDPGDITFDAFGGSGTSIIAAEQTGRKNRSIEIDPGYCAVILDRFETATGKSVVKNDT
jgi:DNA modification methylase